MTWLDLLFCWCHLLSLLSLHTKDFYSVNLSISITQVMSDHSRSRELWGSPRLLSWTINVYSSSHYVQRENHRDIPNTGTVAQSLIGVRLQRGKCGIGRKNRERSEWGGDSGQKNKWWKTGMKGWVGLCLFLLHIQRWGHYRCKYNVYNFCNIHVMSVMETAGPSISCIWVWTLIWYWLPGVRS